MVPAEAATGLTATGSASASFPLVGSQGNLLVGQIPKHNTVRYINGVPTTAGGSLLPLGAPYLWGLPTITGGSPLPLGVPYLWGLPATAVGSLLPLWALPDHCGLPAISGGSLLLLWAPHYCCGALLSLWAPHYCCGAPRYRCGLPITAVGSPRPLWVGTGSVYKRRASVIRSECQ